MSDNRKVRKFERELTARERWEIPSGISAARTGFSIMLALMLLVLALFGVVLAVISFWDFFNTDIYLTSTGLASRGVFHV